MDKKFIIPLASLAVVFSFMSIFINIGSKGMMGQQAASLRASNTPAYQNVQNTPTNANARNQFQPLACTVSVTNNPPVLPSLTIPNVPFSAQEVVHTFSVTSSGCNPGDAYFNGVDMVVISTNTWAMRMDNLTIVDTTSGTASPVTGLVYGAPLSTFSFNIGTDLSLNTTTTYEIRSDFNPDINVLSSSDNIITVMNNYNIANSLGVPVIPNTSGMTSQQMFY